MSITPAKVISIDSVGMTAIVCRRSTQQRTTTRKFKATCGSVVEFTIGTAGNILSTKQHHEHCRSNCSACVAKETFAKMLIESGK